MRAPTATALARIRAAAVELQTDTCTVYHKTRVTNGAGGYTNTESSATYTCRVSPSAGFNLPMELLTSGKINTFSTWFVTLPYNATVAKDDRIVANSQTFEVLGIHQGKTWIADLDVLCSKVS